MLPLSPSPAAGAPKRARTASAPRRGPTRRRLLAGVVVAAALVLAGCMNADQQHAFDLVNASRQRAGLPVLAHDATAQNKAQAWAEHLATIGRLEHSQLAEGMDDHWHRLGENVGVGRNIGEVHRAYLGSHGHRANMLDRSFTHLGVGVARTGGRTYTVQVYVRR